MNGMQSTHLLVEIHNSLDKKLQVFTVHFDLAKREKFDVTNW